MSNTKKIKKPLDDKLQMDIERQLIMDALQDLFLENEAEVRNGIVRQLSVYLVGDDSERDKALQLAIRVARGVEDEQE